MPARVLTIAQQKGGSGKTTLAAHLAIAWSLAGHKVALVDIDPQASLMAWDRMRAERGEKAAPLDIRAVTGWRLASESERLARDHDIVLVDSPAHDEGEARFAIRAADLVIVPMQPSPVDFWATQATLDLARREVRPALVVLNRVPARANLVGKIRQKIGEAGARLAATTIGNRVALAGSLIDGEGIGEAEPSSTAAKEIAALAEEILRTPGRR